MRSSTVNRKQRGKCDFTFFYKYALIWFVTYGRTKANDMKEIIERVQEQLNNNWAVDAEDIQALIDYIERETKTEKG